MRFKTTQELYHEPDCDADLMKMIGDKAETRRVSSDKLEKEGYDPCPHCNPDQ